VKAGDVWFKNTRTGGFGRCARVKNGAQAVSAVVRDSKKT